MRFAWIATLALVPACQLYFLGGDDEPETCDRPTVAGPQFRLVNPDTLACETFSQPGCDYACGPCPGGAIYIPPWGACDSPCIGLSESACMADEQCRVARSYSDYYESSPIDDFMGCYPLNTAPSPAVQECDGLDAEQCAWQSDCTALYSGAPGQCNALTPEQCIGAQFEQCIPEERTDPGHCRPAACRQATPDCPTGTTPGVDNYCYTGACIPNQYCDPVAL
ncbi:MAG: hypothetical protein ACKV2T_36890 [Kofleriaceae bacterium]